jgi:hypothetical protein
VNDDDEHAEFWAEQTQLPLLRRSWHWWSEVALSNTIASGLIVLLSLSLAATIVLTVYEWLR